MSSTMRKPPFHRSGESEGFDRDKRWGPFRLWVTRYRNWTNFYGSTFSHAQFWIGPRIVEFSVDYRHFAWPEFWDCEREVTLRWSFPVLRYLGLTVNHSWKIALPFEGHPGTESVRRAGATGEGEE